MSELFAIMRRTEAWKVGTQTYQESSKGKDSYLKASRYRFPRHDSMLMLPCAMSPQKYGANREAQTYGGHGPPNLLIPVFGIVLLENVKLTDQDAQNSKHH